MMGPETPGTFTKRPYARGDEYFVEQLEALPHMRSLGAEWIEALVRAAPAPHAGRPRAPAAPAPGPRASRHAPPRRLPASPATG